MTITGEQNFLISENKIANSGTDSCPSSSFTAFAELCEHIESTERKSEKSVLVADYFTSLSQEELITASRCLSGYVFPIRENHTVSVSNLVILNCLAACAGVPVSFVKNRILNIGDVGELARELFSGGLSISLSETLTLISVINSIKELAFITGTKRKSEIIVRLLRKATSLEAKFIVRILTGELGIGIQERDIEDAISRWKDISFVRVQSANMLLGDIGETALLVSRGNIDDIRMRLYRPVNYMHAVPLDLKGDLTRALPEQFIIEDKFDGVRVQVHIGLDAARNEQPIGVVYDGLRIAIFSDILEDITAKFPDLIPGLAALLTVQAGTVDAVGVILDGQIVPVKNGEIMPFSEMKSRIASLETEPSLVSEISVGFVAFDQLFGDGRSLIQENWYTRASNLDKIRFDMSTTFRARSTMASNTRELEGILDIAMARGSAGLMLKNPKSCYRPGRREKDWHKVYGRTLVDSR